MKVRKILSIIVASAMLMWQVPMMALANEQPPPVASSTDTTAVSEPAPPTTTTATPTEPPPPAPSPTPSSTSATATAPAPVATGPSAPTGADSPKYVYNSESGNWESDKYVWNPSTGQTQPKQDPGYYYNSTTGTWDTTEWVYRPESGRYEAVNNAVAQSPMSASGPNGANLSSSPQTLAEALSALLGPLALSNTNTGPGSTNTISSDSSNTGFFDLFSRANILNNVNSSATSGDAMVNGNTTAGNAITGAASAVSNILSLLNSSWAWASGALNFFAKNVFGNHFGDIQLNPGTATGGGGLLGGYAAGLSNSNTGPDSTNTIDAGANNELTVVNRPSGTITNNVDILAQSGDAAVSGNTVGGNAASGDASAVVNLLNLINSSISAGQSFFGLLNIFGNLNGDVLFPDGFLTDALQGAAAGGTGLAASNSLTGPDSTNAIDASLNNNLNIQNSPQANFNNNISAGAQSGGALVQGNTFGGSAASGNASTDQNLYNLSNTNLFGQNGVLVLVNVGGTWTGQIMNLPAGSNPGTASALLTSGATLENTGTGPGSANNLSSTQNNDLTVQNSPTGTITNNVRAGAISGDANVTNNTRAGDATSGNARVATNTANIFNSNLNLGGWFGVLVVNVVGDWFGSVNNDTEAGEITNLGFGGQATVASDSQASETTTSFSSSVSKPTEGIVGQGKTTNVSSADSTTGISGSKIGGGTGPTLIRSEQNPIVSTKTAAQATSLFVAGMALSLLLAGACLAGERRLRMR